MPKLKITYPVREAAPWAVKPYDEPIAAALRALVGYSVEISTTDEPLVFMDVTEVAVDGEVPSVVGQVPGGNGEWTEGRVPLRAVRKIAVV